MAQLVGLTPGKTYFYRLAASNNQGDSAQGEKKSFKTAGHAGLPQIGRCKASPTKTGRYTDGACKTFSAGENTGGFEWLPGPSAGGLNGKLGGAKIGAAGQLEVRCTGGTVTGAVSGPTSIDASIVLEGCHTAKSMAPCQTAEPIPKSSGPNRSTARSTTSPAAEHRRWASRWNRRVKRPRS